MSTNGLKRALFGTTLIQRQRRVALDSNLLKSLELKIEEEKIAISLDVAIKTICVEKVLRESHSDGSRKGT